MGRGLRRAKSVGVNKTRLAAYGMEWGALLERMNEMMTLHGCFHEFSLLAVYIRYQCKNGRFSLTSTSFPKVVPVLAGN
jgi:hypothetical protein